MRGRHFRAAQRRLDEVPAASTAPSGAWAAIERETLQPLWVKLEVALVGIGPNQTRKRIEPLDCGRDHAARQGPLEHD